LKYIEKNHPPIVVVVVLGWCLERDDHHNRSAAKAMSFAARATN